MSEELAPIPRKVLIAAGLLIASTFVIAGIGRYTQLGASRRPAATVVRSVDLRFLDAEDGGVEVTYADGRPLTRLEPGTNGFIRGVLRSLARARRHQRVEVDPPFRLALWSDHRITIDDPATGRSVDVSGFGRDNSGAFARLLAANATLAPALGPRLGPGRE